MTYTIRPESPGDIPIIEAITATAFEGAPHSSQTEHFIVNALRRNGKLTVSLVAEENGEAVGHVAISPVTLSDSTSGWFGLGPVSVLPVYQGRGIGSRLIQEALAQLRLRGAAGCVVLGEPRYYSRFGFRAESALVLPEVPPEYFQALAFGATLPQATVAYDKAFDATD